MGGSRGHGVHTCLAPLFTVGEMHPVDIFYWDIFALNSYINVSVNLIQRSGFFFFFNYYSQIELPVGGQRSLTVRGPSYDPREKM